MGAASSAVLPQAFHGLGNVPAIMQQMKKTGFARHAADQRDRLCMQNRRCVSENLVLAIMQQMEKTGFACKTGDVHE